MVEFVTKPAEELEPLPGSSRFTLTMPVVDFLIAETVAGL